MAEKLVAYSSPNWGNFGAYSYYYSGGNADAESGIDHSSACSHKAKRNFTISGEVQTAVLDLEIWWDCYAGAGGNGAVAFVVYLRQPDDDLIELASFSDSGDSNGSMMLCNDLDISAYMTATGTYSIEIWCTLTSAWSVPIDEPVYVQSFGTWVGPPSLLVTERLTKTVLEAVGGGEVNKPGANVTRIEQAGLGETYSTIGGGPDMMKFEKSGFQEFLEAAVAVSRAEVAGLGESLTRTYSYRQHDVPGIPDGAGLAEYLTARWEAGNYVTERDILAESDIWEDIAAPETNWEIE